MKRLVLFGIFALLLSGQQRVHAQCSVCKQSVESASEDDKLKKRVNGLNKGILYLMAVPYAMGAVGFYIYRQNKKKAGPPEELPS